MTAEPTPTLVNTPRVRPAISEGNLSAWAVAWNSLSVYADQLERELKIQDDANEILTRDLALAQSRLAEVEKDAARYWAKRHIDCLKFMETKGYKTCKDTDSLIIAWNLSYDAAIDEAIKRSSP